MNHELPAGWLEVTLPSVAQLNMGQSPPSKSYNAEGNGLPFFQGKAEFGKIYPSAVKYCTAPSKIADAGDVLISVRAPVGPTNLCRERSCIGRGLAALRPIGDIPALYLLYYLRSIEGWLSQQGTGSTFTAISKSDLEELTLPLPPLAEQGRIVAKLEKLFERVDACQARLASVPALFKRFRQSVLAAACSGRLTEDWRTIHQVKGISAELVGSEYEVPSTWKSGPLVELAKFIDYRGRTPKKVQTGIPLITAKNIRPGYIDREPREFMREEEYEPWMTRGIPRLGDVLITTEAPLGYVAAVDISEKFALAQRVICLQFHEPRNQRFALIFMMSPAFQAKLTEQATGTTVSGIKASRLKQLHILLPPYAEQQEIVRRVEKLFALADQIEARFAEAKKRVDSITQSVLAKAFRGELVPTECELAKAEGRSFESAEELLERIKANGNAKTDRKRRAGLANKRRVAVR